MVASPAPTRLIQTPPPRPSPRPPTELPAAEPPADGQGDMPPAPAARKMMEEKGLSPDDVQGSGRRGQILKEDVMAAALRPSHAAAPAEAEAAAYGADDDRAGPAAQMRAPSVPNDAAREERVKMTRLRQTIARRLKDAQNTAAMLTTFNDVDMSAIMDLGTSTRTCSRSATA